MENYNGIEFRTVVTNMVELKRCHRSVQSYKKHMHHELSVGIICEGTTTVKFPEGIICFTQGDGVIIPPKLSHMCSPDDVDNWHFDMLYIDSEFYENALKFDRAVRVSVEKRDMIKAFMAMLDEDMNQSYIEEQLIVLLVKLSEDEEDSVAVSTKESEAVCEELKDYIDTHYTEKLTLEELQKRFEVDKFEIIRRFGKLYNTPPMAYQLQLKVAEAKRRLRAQIPLLDVCYDLGFYDQAHFTKEFQKMNGLTPSAYQKSFQV